MHKNMERKIHEHKYSKHIFQALRNMSPHPSLTIIQSINILTTIISYLFNIK